MALLTEHRISISESQLDYLRQSTFLPKELALVVQRVEPGAKGATIMLEQDVVEEFRTAFTERLAACGFDMTYRPNREGRHLEELIDVFGQ